MDILGGGGGGGGGHHNIGLYLGVISMHFRVILLRSRYRMGDIFFGCYNFKYFWGCLKFLIFFFFGGGGVKGRCWARAYV